MKTFGDETNAIEKNTLFVFVRVGHVTERRGAEGRHRPFDRSDEGTVPHP